ncbi:MAG: sigma 54-interacting transcriptional regulator, partial [Candidatus Binatia bacterium]
MGEPDGMAAERAEAPTEAPRRGACHFHLLWDEELDELEPVLDTIARRREDVLSHWYRLYVIHFGDERALTESEFRQIYGSDLDATTTDLRQKNLDAFAANVRRVGEILAQRRVPFPEVVASMHFFEESAHRVFPSTSTPGPRIWLAFDKLSHCRMIVLADAYFLSRNALSAARIRDLERQATELDPDRRRFFHGIVGGSAVMRKLYDRIQAAAATRGTILIAGESGTGKELVARAIHECGPRPGTPFVALNCAAIPRELIESELFGYKRGAFSGAATEYLGLFRAAEGGTLFLDEITEMSPETQTKLLRALQER